MPRCDYYPVVGWVVIKLASSTIGTTIDTTVIISGMKTPDASYSPSAINVETIVNNVSGNVGAASNAVNLTPNLLSSATVVSSSTSKQDVGVYYTFSFSTIGTVAATGRVELVFPSDYGLLASNPDPWCSEVTGLPGNPACSITG
jgi:hypothetical protein